MFIQEFPNDNKQEILEPKNFNIFYQCTFKQIILIVEVFKSMIKNPSRILLRRSRFQIGSYSEIYQQNLERYLKRNPFLKYVVRNLSAKSLEEICEEIHILASCSVSMNKIFDIHLREKSFFLFTIFVRNSILFTYIYIYIYVCIYMYMYIFYIFCIQTQVECSISV